jgi:hypothetical protein
VAACLRLCVCLSYPRVPAPWSSHGVLLYETPDLSAAASASHGVLRACVQSSSRLCSIATHPISLHHHPRSAYLPPIFLRRSFGASQLLSLLICFTARCPHPQPNPLSAYPTLACTNPHNTFTKGLAGLAPGREPKCSLENTSRPRLSLLRRAHLVLPILQHTPPLHPTSPRTTTCIP